MRSRVMDAYGALATAYSTQEREELHERGVGDCEAKLKTKDKPFPHDFYLKRV